MAIVERTHEITLRHWDVLIKLFRIFVFFFLQPPSMISAECQTLTQQCGDELGLFPGNSGSGGASGRATVTTAPTTTTTRSSTATMILT